MTMSTIAPRKIWAVWTNTDLTEGRGAEYVKHYCELETTARRLAKRAYVQGTDARVTETELFYSDGNWYAPGPLVEVGTREDKEAEIKILAERERKIARDAVRERALALGLSEEELALLKENG